MAGVRLTDNDMVLLRGVRLDDVTWSSDMGGRVTFKLWETETEHFVVTRRMKQLEVAGLVKRYTGYRFGSGGVELTEQGKQAELDFDLRAQGLVK